MHEPSVDRTNVQKPIVIEVAGEPLKIMGRDEAKYDYHTKPSRAPELLALLNKSRDPPGAEHGFQGPSDIADAHAEVRGDTAVWTPALGLERLDDSLVDAVQSDAAVAIRHAQSSGNVLRISQRSG
jgi:hypothetical protein